jgi:hypothetical protein
MDVAWERYPWLDVPIPIENIKFWEAVYLITTDNRYLICDFNGGWTDMGPWPGPESAAPEAAAAAVSASPKTVPNPSAGSCRVTFQTAAVGPVSVQASTHPVA